MNHSGSKSWCRFKAARISGLNHHSDSSPIDTLNARRTGKFATLVLWSSVHFGSKSSLHGICHAFPAMPCFHGVGEVLQLPCHSGRTAIGRRCVDAIEPAAGASLRPTRVLCRRIWQRAASPNALAQVTHFTDVQMTFGPSPPKPEGQAKRTGRTEALDRRNFSVDIEGKHLLGSIGSPEHPASSSLARESPCAMPR